MPAFIGWLIGAFAQYMPAIVGRVLLALGIGIVTYTGIDATTTALIAYVKSNVQGMWPVVLQMAALIQLDVAINMLAAAISTRLAIQGLSGVVSKFVVKP